MIIFIGAMSAAAKESKDEAIKKEWACLTGKWKVISGEMNGKKN